MWDGTPDSFIIINGLCLKNQVKHKSVLVNFPLKNAVFLIKKNTASGKAEELRIHVGVQPLIWPVCRRTDNRYYKKTPPWQNALRWRSFEYTTRCSHLFGMPYSWHSSLQKSANFRHKHLAMFLVEDSIPLGFNNNAAENSDGVFITRPPPKCNRLLHVFFISIISGQPANDVFPVLPKSKRKTPPRIKGFFPQKKYEPTGKILTDVSRPTDPLQNRHLPIPADIIRHDSDNRPRPSRGFFTQA